MQRGPTGLVRRHWRALATVALLAAAVIGKWLTGEALPPKVEGVAQLIDGDSFRLGGHEVRLKGIDAPEGRQTCRRNTKDWACGEEARRELQRIAGGRAITCDVASKDQHGRLLAYCRAGSRDINAAMVASGYALSYGSYLKEEGSAKAAKRGLWSGEFERPRDWRRRSQ